MIIVFQEDAVDNVVCKMAAIYIGLIIFNCMHDSQGWPLAATASEAYVGLCTLIQSNLFSVELYLTAEEFKTWCTNITGARLMLTSLGHIDGQ